MIDFRHVGILMLLDGIDHAVIFTCFGDFLVVFSNLSFNHVTKVNG